MASDYDSQATYVKGVESAAKARAHALASALLEAFEKFVVKRKVDVIRFESMSAEELADVLTHYPPVVKPLLAICNIAGRAVERDLGIRGLNTYSPRLNAESALIISGYIKSFLPKEIELNSLVQLDRVHYIDKEVRAFKGSWEKRVRESLNSFQPGFKKRRFTVDDEVFEIDAASPETGAIQTAVDVKRIEARRDIHKRCDEIINKASKFKKVFPGGQFAAVIYYPFISEHQNVRSRLRSPDIDAVYFAGATPESIATCAEMLLAQLRETNRE